MQAAVQLAAVGPQDLPLYDGAERSLFAPKPVVRHAPFATEFVTARFDAAMAYLGETSAFPLFADASRTVTCVVRPKGTLLRSCTLELTLPALPQHEQGASFVRWTPSVAFAMIERVELLVDGNVLQRFSGKYMRLASERHVGAGSARGYDRMTGRGASHDGLTPVTYHLPLPFCFERGSALPFAPFRRGAELQVRFMIRPLLHCVLSNRVLTASFHRRVLCDAHVVYEVVHESAIPFAPRSRELLIEEVQEQEATIVARSRTAQVHLETSRATKECFWTVQDHADALPNTVFGNRHVATDGWHRSKLGSLSRGESLPPAVRAAQVYLGNQAREPSTADGDGVDEAFFRLVQPYKHGAVPRDYVYGYTFAMEPRAFGPSGHHDFSATTNHLYLQLQEGLRSLLVRFYAVTYNTLIFREGQAALEFVD
jgi:hypothetical protein